jgi:hypothetical protein
MAFNLEDYTTVQERSNIFWERYPNGAVRTKIISESDTRVIVVCELFRDSADEKPFATGHAKEVISDRGVNRDFALENCETSARGVAFKAANIGTEKNGPSREEMARVVKTQTNYSAPGSRARAVENVLRQSFAEDKKEPTVWSVGDPLTLVPQTPPKPQVCANGEMLLKQGVAKTGKSYYGYVCNCGKPKDQQCAAKWAKMTSNGNWYFPDDAEDGKGGE